MPASKNMALYLVNYDWKRLLEVRWGAKNLFPVKIENLETSYTSLTTIHRFVIWKTAAFRVKVSQISNLGFFNVRVKLSLFWKWRRTARVNARQKR